MNDLNPERALIGIAMAKPTALSGVDVDLADFGTPANAAVWRIITRLRERGEPTDAASVAGAVKSTRGADPDLGPVDDLWIHQVLHDAPIAAMADRYAALVADGAARRRLYGLLSRGHQMLTEVESADEVIDELRAELDGLTRSAASIRLIGDTLEATIESLSQPPTAVPTPWQDLDHLIRGWRPGALYVIAARPGVGKSIAAIDAALGLSKHGYVAISSLEMPEAELHGRIIANRALVRVNEIDAHNLSDDDWAKLSAQIPSLLALRISIDARPSVTITDVKAHARALARKGPLAGVIVDYLQLMEAPAGDRRPRHELIASYSRGLKTLAGELNVPVIALSQLNRGPEQRADKRPTLGDLRESGAIEQDADVVMLLHESETDETDLNVFVAKNRHGARGSFQVIRRGWYARLDTPGGNSAA